MDTRMKVGCGGKKCSVVVSLCLLVALSPGYAQKKPVAATPDATRKVLVEKARALESRGRPDMAIQSWQQVLLSDPNNADALAGMARDYKLIGSTDKAADALERLRRANPNDPNIGKIAEMTSTKVQSDKLRQAGELARQGKLDDAMRIYRELYDDRPPDGDIALAYYQTLYGTSAGKEQAIQAMRSLAQRNPGDSRFAVELGIMLTYETRTRPEGIRILQEHIKDANAEAGLRQALIWDAANPGTASELRQYLKTHPQDEEIAKRLKEDEGKLAQMNSGIARTPEERAAFAALNAHRLDEAQERFMALLEKDAANGRVLAGLGFLRMQQNNFGGAISYLTQAEQSGYKARAVEIALETSRFWYTMGEASQAFDDNQLDVAMAKYKDALAVHPRSPEALIGLAGLLVKEQQYPAAADTYEQLIKVQPASSEAWRGLFLAFARDGQNQKAMTVAARFPAAVKTSLAKDPEYLRTLAAIYQAMNRPEDARRTLVLALSLPFPDNGTTLKVDTRLQYAGILMEAKHYQQAAEMYIQILNEDMSNLSAWMGLVSAHHQLNQDTEAIADVSRMPAPVYESAIADPGFLTLLGGIYQQANQFEVAQGLLERSAKLQIDAGGQPPLNLQLQLAAIYLQRNDSERAYSLYRQILNAQPNSVDAWKGLIASLLNTNRNAEALQEIAQIPTAVRKQLESDIDFVQSEASAYATTGDTQHAIEIMNRVLAHYTASKTLPPANVEIQNAWLLYNTKNDRGLYPALMRLGARKDLTVPQRETVQTIWASWSVRRAQTAMDNGNIARAVEILEAAEAAFPDNLTVRKSVAGGYVRVGRAREALALFKTVPMQDASAGDYQGAVGAALAAGDKSLAEVWLRQALDRYPRDPAILQLAARYEQARGDNQRAADYYRASLAVMPKTSAANRLAHELVYPDQDDKPRKPSTPADLQRLLDPNYEPFQKTLKLPSLPAYGVDPYNAAPVVLGEQQVVAPQEQVRTAPATADPYASVVPQTAPQAAYPSVQPEAPVAADQQGSAATPPVGKLSRKAKKGKNYAGTMHIPAAEQNVATPAAVNSQQPIAQDNGLAMGGDALNPLPSQVAAQPERSLAGDAWKGLVFSLLSDNRPTEALQQIGQIPSDIRRQLESDVEFEQAEANLYTLTGDTVRAADYMNRVQSYYAIRRTTLPPAIAVQNAWLLYNSKNDHALYPALQSLDARRDLTDAQRSEVQTIWADWSARRALSAVESGSSQRALLILDAAIAEYPNNPNVRMAVAGGYVRLGRAEEALAIFKAIPLQNASAENMQRAVSAALAAKDMTLAETWLRQALARYPSDPGVLSVAARFEQARGNSLRASDYWRAALAAMPPGASMPNYDTVPADSGHYEYRQVPMPGELKQLLNPDGVPPQTLAPLPARAYATPSTSHRPLPVPAQVSQAAANEPLYQPQSIPQSTPMNTAQPVFIEQSATQQLILPRYNGSLPVGEGIGIATGSSAGQIAPTPHAPSPSQWTADSNPAQGLRITSQPMDAVAARAQALFADQTDSQLTQGSAETIHALPVVQAHVTPQPSAPSYSGGQYTVAQYTPSAQDAASGAYSAPKAQTAPTVPVQQNLPKPAATPQPAQEPVTAKKKKRAVAPQLPPVTESAPARRRAPAKQPVETLETAPVNPPAEQIQVTDLPGGPEPASTTGLSDDELQQRNLPPLRGPWSRMQRQQRELTPRDEAEMQLRSIESGYSAWLGGAGYINYRSGDLGYDHLAALEAPFELSMPVGNAARLTIVAKPVFLDSGQATGTSTMTVQEQTTSATTLVNIPQPIGTLTTTDVTPPAQQNAAGIGGEIQLAFSNFAVAGGYTPAGFLVATVTARAQWRPGNGPFTFSFNRDSVKDTQLSYAGLRDPSGNTLGSAGQIWGGVVANQFNAQYAHGDAMSGFYLGLGGQYLNGYQVETNDRIEGSGGAYWRVLANPEYGNLSIGVNFFGMHYAHDEDAFTHGMGGYFSPQAYFLGNAPVSWVGHYGTRWHYNIMGSLGVQAFQSDLTPLFPFKSDSALEVALSNASLPAKTSVGPNYDFRSQVAYQISPHWFVGGFLSGNNSRNYGSVSTGFSVHYLFRSQPSTVAGPTGLFPTDGVRPFRVP
jgi:tetratricopeptide (TPR) repeat protein